MPAPPARATVTLSQTAASPIGPPPFPRRARPPDAPEPAGAPEGCTLDSAAHVKPGYATSAARPWLSVLPGLAPGAIWELRDSDADDDDDE